MPTNWLKKVEYVPPGTWVLGTLRWLGILVWLPARCLGRFGPAGLDAVTSGPLKPPPLTVETLSWASLFPQLGWTHGCHLDVWPHIFSSLGCHGWQGLLGHSQSASGFLGVVLLESLTLIFQIRSVTKTHRDTHILCLSLSHTHPHTLPVLSFWCCASFGCALLQKQQLETRSFLSFFSPPALIDDLEWSVNLTLIERKEKKKKNIQLLPYFPPQQIDQVSLQITSPHIYSSCCHSIIPNMTSMWNC